MEVGNILKLCLGKEPSIKFIGYSGVNIRLLPDIKKQKATRWVALSNTPPICPTKSLCGSSVSLICPGQMHVYSHSGNKSPIRIILSRNFPLFWLSWCLASISGPRSHLRVKTFIWMDASNPPVFLFYR